MNDKQTMMDYYKKRGVDDPSFTFGFPLSLTMIGAISSTGILINDMVKDWVWEVSGFISLCLWFITFLPYFIYKVNTHIPRRIRKANERAQQRELEMRELRVRERELGLDEWEYGKLGS